MTEFVDLADFGQYRYILQRQYGNHPDSKPREHRSPQAVAYIDRSKSNNARSTRSKRRKSRDRSRSRSRKGSRSISAADGPTYDSQTKNENECDLVEGVEKLIRKKSRQKVCDDFGNQVNNIDYAIFDGEEFQQDKSNTKSLFQRVDERGSLGKTTVLSIDTPKHDRKRLTEYQSTLPTEPCFPKLRTESEPNDRHIPVDKHDIIPSGLRSKQEESTEGKHVLKDNNTNTYNKDLSKMTRHLLEGSNTYSNNKVISKSIPCLSITTNDSDAMNKNSNKKEEPILNVPFHQDTYVLNNDSKSNVNASSDTPQHIDSNNVINFNESAKSNSDVSLPCGSQESHKHFEETKKHRRKHRKHKKKKRRSERKAFDQGDISQSASDNSIDSKKHKKKREKECSICPTPTEPEAAPEAAQASPPQNRCHVSKSESSVCDLATANTPRKKGKEAHNSFGLLGSLYRNNRSQSEGRGLLKMFSNTVGSCLNNIAQNHGRYYFPSRRHLFVPDVGLDSAWLTEYPTSKSSPYKQAGTGYTGNTSVDVTSRLLESQDLELMANRMKYMSQPGQADLETRASLKQADSKELHHGSRHGHIDHNPTPGQQLGTSQNHTYEGQEQDERKSFILQSPEAMHQDSLREEIVHRRDSSKRSLQMTRSAKTKGHNSYRSRRSRAKVRYACDSSPQDEESNQTQRVEPRAYTPVKERHNTTEKHYDNGCGRSSQDTEDSVEESHSLRPRRQMSTLSTACMSSHTDSTSTVYPRRHRRKLLPDWDVRDVRDVRDRDVSEGRAYRAGDYGHSGESLIGEEDLVLLSNISRSNCRASNLHLANAMVVDNLGVVLKYADLPGRRRKSKHEDRFKHKERRRSSSRKSKKGLKLERSSTVESCSKPNCDSNETSRREPGFAHNEEKCLTIKMTPSESASFSSKLEPQKTAYKSEICDVLDYETLECREEKEPCNEPCVEHNSDTRQAQTKPELEEAATHCGSDRESTIIEKKIHNELMELKRDVDRLSELSESLLAQRHGSTTTNTDNLQNPVTNNDSENHKNRCFHNTGQCVLSPKTKPSHIPKVDEYRNMPQTARLANDTEENTINVGKSGTNVEVGTSSKSIKNQLCPKSGVYDNIYLSTTTCDQRGEPLEARSIEKTRCNSHFIVESNINEVKSVSNVYDKYEHNKLGVSHTTFDNLINRRQNARDSEHNNRISERPYSMSVGGESQQLFTQKTNEKKNHSNSMSLESYCCNSETKVANSIHFIDKFDQMITPEQPTAVARQEIGYSKDFIDKCMARLGERCTSQVKSFSCSKERSLDIDVEKQKTSSFSNIVERRNENLLNLQKYNCRESSGTLCLHSGSMSTGNSAPIDDSDQKIPWPEQRFQTESQLDCTPKRYYIQVVDHQDICYNLAPLSKNQNSSSFTSMSFNYKRDVFYPQLAYNCSLRANAKTMDKIPAETFRPDGVIQKKTMPNPNTANSEVALATTMADVRNSESCIEISLSTSSGDRGDGRSTNKHQDKRILMFSMNNESWQAWSQSWFGKLRPGNSPCGNGVTISRSFTLSPLYNRRTDVSSHAAIKNCNLTLQPRPNSAPRSSNTCENTVRQKRQNRPCNVQRSSLQNNDTIPFEECLEEILSNHIRDGSHMLSDSTDSNMSTISDKDISSDVETTLAETFSSIVFDTMSSSDAAKNPNVSHETKPNTGVKKDQSSEKGSQFRQMHSFIVSKARNVKCSLDNVISKIYTDHSNDYKKELKSCRSSSATEISTQELPKQTHLKKKVSSSKSTNHSTYRSAQKIFNKDSLITQTTDKSMCRKGRQGRSRLNKIQNIRSSSPTKLCNPDDTVSASESTLQTPSFHKTDCAKDEQEHYAIDRLDCSNMTENNSNEMIALKTLFTRRNKITEDSTSEECSTSKTCESYSETCIKYDSAPARIQSKSCANGKGSSFYSWFKEKMSKELNLYTDSHLKTLKEFTYNIPKRIPEISFEDKNMSKSEDQHVEEHTSEFIPSNSFNLRTGIGRLVRQMRTSSPRSRRVSQRLANGRSSRVVERSSPRQTLEPISEESRFSQSESNECNYSIDGSFADSSSTSITSLGDVHESDISNTVSRNTANTCTRLAKSNKSYNCKSHSFTDSHSMQSDRSHSDSSKIHEKKNSMKNSDLESLCESLREKHANHQIMCSSKAETKSHEKLSAFSELPSTPTVRFICKDNPFTKLPQMRASCHKQDIPYKSSFMRNEVLKYNNTFLNRPYCEHEYTNNSNTSSACTNRYDKTPYARETVPVRSDYRSGARHSRSRYTRRAAHTASSQRSNRQSEYRELHGNVGSVNHREPACHRRFPHDGIASTCRETLEERGRTGLDRDLLLGNFNDNSNNGREDDSPENHGPFSSTTNKIQTTCADLIWGQKQIETNTSQESQSFMKWKQSSSQGKARLRSNGSGAVSNDYNISNKFALCAGKNINGSGNMMGSLPHYAQMSQSLGYPIDAEELRMSCSVDMSPPGEGSCEIDELNDTLLVEPCSGGFEASGGRPEIDITCNHPSTSSRYIGDGSYCVPRNISRDDILMKMSPCCQSGQPYKKFPEHCRPSYTDSHRFTDSDTFRKIKDNYMIGGQTSIAVPSSQSLDIRRSYCGGQGDTQAKHHGFTDWYVTEETVGDTGIPVDVETGRELSISPTLDKEEQSSGESIISNDSFTSTSSTNCSVGEVEDVEDAVMSGMEEECEGREEEEDYDFNELDEMEEVASVASNEEEWEDESDEDGCEAAAPAGCALSYAVMRSRDTRNAVKDLTALSNLHCGVCQNCGKEGEDFSQNKHDSMVEMKQSETLARLKLAKDTRGESSVGEKMRKEQQSKAYVRHRSGEDTEDHYHHQTRSDKNKSLTKRFSFDEIKVPSIDKDRVRFACSETGEWAEVGRGSYGCVYLGLLDGQVEVAIKDFYESSSWDLVIHEARMLLFLQETGITPTFYGLRRRFNETKDPSEYCIIMEYFGDGRTLFNVMSDKIPLAPEEWLDVVGQLVAGLRLIHSRQVLINDLKADNILIDLSSGRKTIRYIDVGMATYRQGLTFQLPTDQMNKYNFLAPEVREGANTSTKSDIYSLGYMLDQIMRLAGPALSGLDKLVVRCLDKEPANRPDIDEIVSQVHWYIVTKSHRSEATTQQPIFSSNSV